MNQLTTSLWGDESFTAVAVQENFFRMLQIVAKDTAPPGYYILLFVWTRIFGHSEVAIRMLSVLLYLGTVLVAFLLVKKIWGRKAALLVGLLTLANPFLFPFAFEGRMYAILVFTVTLSFYFFMTKNYWGYIGAAALALYSHHYAALAIIFQFFWRLGETKNLVKNWFKFLEPYLLIGILYLPWLYPLYKQVTLVSSGFWLGKPKLIDIVGLLGKYYIGGTTVFWWQKFWVLVALLILALRRWQEKTKQSLVLVGWALVPIALAFLLSQGKTSIFYDRYLIYIIPALMILLATNTRKISFYLVIVFCLPLLWLNIYYFIHPTKRPFRALAQYVKNNVDRNLLLINYNGKAHHLWETKYYGLQAPLYIKGEMPYYIGTAQMTKNDLIQLLPDKPMIGVISSDPPDKIELLGFYLNYYQQFGDLYFAYFVKQ